jgi:hypothetical protein
MRALLLLVVVCLGFSNSSDRWVGRYELRRSFDHDRLELRPDGSFWLSISSCTYNKKLKGKWHVDTDTLRLEFAFVKERKGRWKPHTGEDGIVWHFQKGFLRGDSLDLRWIQSMGFHRSMALVRVDEATTGKWKH